MHAIFLVFGVIVHLVLLYSIFDVYYSSPLVKNARPHPITKNGIPPASRLVIFSADGLRSSTFFERPEKSPFLHEIIRNGKGSWGISKSHVPTESRPGHVAMMAGFYEDVSAVARGWKHNPVPFDSTLNESNRAFIWGSPDIVGLFAETLKPGTLQVSESYSADEEDFASNDASKLDEWVFNKF
ncbi:type I phosphodiesterase / nucleotide pyrophosphatase domain-containing protein [Ditylenchus destructor]|uniref:GPI ethanolamine phosphate transferase 1 n=1 Tax=Ditylenchus destructor TaxID=166010 RepID=A0AAD4N0X4_9BILA|nr:type I phosphodiesterase / nucleotide pyrophosphatase domain-containing protein [Ditylenchus destructor]